MSDLEITGDIGNTAVGDEIFEALDNAVGNYQKDSSSSGFDADVRMATVRLLGVIATSLQRIAERLDDISTNGIPS